MAAPAGATPPSGVEFELDTTTPFGEPSFGPFVATGPAVDAGLVCESGDTIDVFAKVSGFTNNGFNVQVVKKFTCDAEPFGDFFVKLQVRIDFRFGVTFNWNVLSGTENYGDLEGTGRGVGLLGSCGDPFACVLDVYGGGLHID